MILPLQNRSQKWFGASAFGLRVRVPIFSSLGRTAGSQKAKLSLLQAETQLIETKAQVFVEWQNAHKTIIHSQKKIIPAHKTMLP